MGRILFIRVSAETYDEKDVLKAWPKLYAAVWPDAGANHTDAPGKILRTLAPSPERGVLQLVDGFIEYVHFGSFPANLKHEFREHADSLEKLRARLDEALGDRDVQTASKLTNSLEDALDEAEKTARQG